LQNTGTAPPNKKDGVQIQWYGTSVHSKRELFGNKGCETLASSTSIYGFIKLCCITLRHIWPTLH